MNDLLQRIVIVPGVCGGQPVIRGMRISVADVLGMLAGGMTPTEILEDYPYLEIEDIHACLAYASSSAKHEELSIKREDAA